MKAISLTAQWTAAIRALESEYGEDRLFEDSLARKLAEPDGFRLLDQYKGAGVREFVSIRTRFFDDEISDVMLETSIRQVVIVAAGMDTRAFRLSWPDGIIIYELDHKDLFEEKNKRLLELRAQPSCCRIEVAVDLDQHWLGDLKRSGFDASANTLWIVEGLLFFLKTEQVDNLLKTLKEASSRGSRLVTDMPSKSLLNAPTSLIFLSKLRNDGYPWQFGSDNPEGFLQMNGWKVTKIKEPGEKGVGEKRWPYTVQDRSIIGVPRNWLICASLDS